MIKIKQIITLIVFLCCGCAADNTPAESELSKIEEVLAASKAAVPLKTLMVNLKLVKQWTPERDKELLIDVEHDWHSVSRIYHARSFKEIVMFDFTGKPKSPSYADSLLINVTTVTISDKRHFHVYRWKDGAYRKVLVGERK
jgi:hypothetical protein